MEMKAINQFIKEWNDCWIGWLNSFQWSGMGYNVRYVFFNQPIKFFCLNKKNQLIPFTAETKELSEEGSSELRINDSLRFRKQRNSKLIMEWTRLTPALNATINLNWDIAQARKEWNECKWMERIALVAATSAFHFSSSSIAFDSEVKWITRRAAMFQIILISHFACGMGAASFLIKINFHSLLACRD